MADQTQNRKNKEGAKEELLSKSEEILQKRKRERIFRVLRVVLLVFFGVGFVVTVVLLWHASEEKMEELESTRQELRRHEGLLEAELLLREDYRAIENSILPVIQTVLPDEEELHVVFEELDLLGARLDAPLSVSLRPLEERDGIQVLPIRLTTRANVTQLRQLLTELENFPYPLLISEYGVNASPSISNEGSVELLVHLFVRIEEEEE